MLRISTSLTLVFLLLFPTMALSDSWPQFQEFNNGYYFLDDQEFASFSCTVILPTVEAMIKNIRKQISADGQMHLLKENLSDFQLTFRKNGEVSFIKPALSVQTDVTQEYNKENLELGVKMIEDGFVSTIGGIVITLESLFTSYIRPARNRYRLESFARDGEKADMRYEFGGMMLDVSCSGEKCTKSSSTGNGEVSIDETYISVTGKKAISGYKGVITQPEQTMTSTLKITYQEIEQTVGQEARKLGVPHEIKGTSIVTHATGTANSAFSIVLENCVVE